MKKNEPLFIGESVAAVPPLNSGISTVGGVIALPSPSVLLVPTGSVYSGTSAVGGVIRFPSPSVLLVPTGSVYSGTSGTDGLSSFGFSSTGAVGVSSFPVPSG